MATDLKALEKSVMLFAAEVALRSGVTMALLKHAPQSCHGSKMLVMTASFLNLRL